MKKANWYTTASMILVLLNTFSSCQSHSSQKEQVASPIVQAHRGGAAEYPENTIAAMLHAVSIGTPVLEMDLHITSDSQVVVSHDAFLHAAKILKPDGSQITEEQARNYTIYTMTYDSLKRYDAGSLFNPQYLHRKQISSHIPLVSELIDSVETFVASHQLSPVCYNIEIKSWPDKDNIYTPDYQTFADLCMKELLAKKLGRRLTIQCFDARTLNYLHKQYPQVTLSYLIEPEKDIDFISQLKRLTFLPPIISPHYQLVNEKLIHYAKQNKIQIIPWTVDDPKEVERLTRLGVDAIITNRPTDVLQWIKNYCHS